MELVTWRRGRTTEKDVVLSGNGISAHNSRDDGVEEEAAGSERALEISDKRRPEIIA
jgi:hypothetical protein